MAGLFKVLLLITSAVLIILSLLQSGKTEGFTGAFSGSKGLDLFSNAKERGAEKVLSNATLVTGILFIVFVVATLMNQ
ncbi:preprotein translocase subunit SecG [Erysipelothrix sp. HDW6C]|uniref:preprotein translocase subunit SecG n=1 Tax=Erysipelothrix sp. HDW6C TaxID=2714930 RepID=UPI0014094062|nr:preprotein translocase subunit SecG [Erysipelothrix sp. HDW6C]QIK69341.1 preprotein translocase subunit SecG [Erysipelothrix sp. HDW6C]